MLQSLVWSVLSAPAEQAWGSFFLGGQTVSEDFMAERDSQQQSDRDSF